MKAAVPSWPSGDQCPQPGVRPRGGPRGHGKVRVQLFPEWGCPFCPHDGAWCYGLFNFLIFLVGASRHGLIYVSLTGRDAGHSFMGLLKALWAPWPIFKLVCPSFSSHRSAWNLCVSPAWMRPCFLRRSLGGSAPAAAGCQSQPLVQRAAFRHPPPQGTPLCAPVPEVPPGTL